MSIEQATCQRAVWLLIRQKRKNWLARCGGNLSRLVACEPLLAIPASVFGLMKVETLHLKKLHSRLTRFEQLEPRRVLATLAINAGGSAAGDYTADQLFSGGGTFSTGDSINVAGIIAPAPTAVYQAERTGQGGSDFTYAITGLNPSESYDLRLHFAEIFWNEAGKRSFDVEINNSLVLNNYDVFVEAGGADRAVIEEFTATASGSGVITLEFLTEVNNAKVSGIEIIGDFPEPQEPTGPTVLFVRGGDRTGGFLEANNDTSRTEHLADINNLQTFGGNHGWGELRQTLEAANFQVEQITEGSETASGPADGIAINFAALDLTNYDALVFGSNNAVYNTASIDAIEDYIRNGGSTLFISDANFGGDWADASNSDQQFLDRFGLIMHQDQGTYAISRGAGDFDVPNHPIFTGVNSFDGEGVTPIEVGTLTSGVSATILANSEGNTRLNNGNGGNNQGSSRPSGPNDAALLVASADAGKVVGHFDRNTFFNQNGAGTNINRLDNQQFALNLFGYLVGAFDPIPGDFNGDRTVDTADYDTWRAAFGTTGSSAADGNNDGMVNAADYTIWRDNLGATGPDVNLSLPAAAESAIDDFATVIFPALESGRLEPQGLSTPMRTPEVSPSSQLLLYLDAAFAESAESAERIEMPQESGGIEDSGQDEGYFKTKSAISVTDIEWGPMS